MGRNLDTVKRLILKLSDKELSETRKYFNEESMRRGLGEDKRTFNRLYNILTDIFPRYRYGYDLGFDEMLNELSELYTEKEFLRFRNVGVAVMMCVNEELKKRNLQFKSDPDTEKPRPIEIAGV